MGNWQQEQQKLSRHLKAVLAQEITGKVREKREGRGNYHSFSCLPSRALFFLAPMQFSLKRSLRYAGARLKKTFNISWRSPLLSPSNDVWACRTQNFHTLSARPRHSRGFPVVPTVELHALPSLAILCQSTNFVRKERFSGLISFSSIFVQ